MREQWADFSDLCTLPVPIVDNHCHLDFAGPEGNARSIEERLAGAAQLGVTRMVQVSHDVESIAFTTAVVTEHPELVGAVALHPNEAAKHVAAGDFDTAFAEVEIAAKQPRIRAIGETGLDFFRTGPEGHAAQRMSFREHINLAKELDLVLQIHDRDAHAEVLEVLAEVGAPERTVFHCFSGDREFAEACVAQGYYLSFSGTVTFKNSRELQAAARVVPTELLLVETDAPFLTPHPQRGKLNHPAGAAVTLTYLAQLRETDLSTLASAVNSTSVALYGPW